MELKDELIEMRKETGLNRKEFAEYFGIPYRTVQDWELGNRQMPEYLFRLMEYKIRIENLAKKWKDYSVDDKLSEVDYDSIPTKL